MAALNIYNLKGEITQEMEMPESLNIKWNADLVHQVVKSLMANRRTSVAHTKIRSEVRGGGKKPWRQKGTGRARHGSTRSPLWKGGGVTFGPRSEKNYEEKINKKMLRKALLCVLAKKAIDGEIKIFESLDIENPKTKVVATAFNKVIKNRSAILLLPEKNKNLRLAARNLARVESVAANQLNAYDALQSKEILMDRNTFEKYAK